MAPTRNAEPSASDQPAGRRIRLPLAGTRTYSAKAPGRTPKITRSPTRQFFTSAPTAEIVPLGDHQLASRLSYLIWATMPDAELSALADAGKLHEPGVLAAQTRRLLADSRSRALFDGFGAQWLGLDKLSGKTFDASKFPQMTPELRASMLGEGRLFFESILRENRSIATFLSADYAFVNETLAQIYGLKGVTGPELRRVALPDGGVSRARPAPPRRLPGPG